MSFLYDTTGELRETQKSYDVGILSQQKKIILKILKLKTGKCGKTS